LAQVLQAAEGCTLGELITQSQAHIHQLEAHLRELESQMALVTNGALDAVLTAYSATTEVFERYGGYDLDSRIDLVLAGLRVAHLPRERPFTTLSGGEKTRVALAMLLLQAPDVLLLDEPTNHLDWETLTWLEDYLAAYRGAVLIVSHDRQFLNRTVNAIVEIDEQKRVSKRYTGNYDAYHAAKVLERQQWETAYDHQQEELKRLRLEVAETARRNDNYRAHTDGDKLLMNAKIAKHEATVSKRIRVAHEQLERILADPIPEPPDPLRFNPEFDPRALHGRYPLTVDGLTKCYGARAILREVSFAVSARSRIALVGENGAGKSTLLRLLMGEILADGGVIQFSHGVRVGYLDQEQRLLMAHGNLSTYEAFAAGLTDDLTYTEQQLKGMLLRTGLFRIDDLFKRVCELSVGQQRKLQIALLMANKANFLILDEPTNHVSFDVLESLEAALRVFPGAVLVATHDRRFLQTFGGEIWRVQDGQLIAQA
jgi:macrolide transport system ATP-binding/permease protein